MASHADTHRHTQHRHVVHFNCLTVWSNSKWICDLSIDSFSLRLWIKRLNYWCSDVRCLLECCMWCRPLSPGKLLPPSLSQPNSNANPSTAAAAAPSRLPGWACSSWQWWNLNTLQAACRQASRQPIGRKLIHTLSLPLHICQPSPPSTAFLPFRGVSVPRHNSTATLSWRATGGLKPP